MDKPIIPREIRKVFEGRIFTVQVETITLPNGGELAAEIVRHPGSVVLIPVTDSGDLLLVRQYRHPIGRWVWELPAGTLKRGEDIEHAAIRECHEEIGLIPSRIEHVGAFYPSPGFCDEIMHFFKATGLRTPTAEDEAAHQDEDEDLEPRPFSRAEVAAMMASGEIVDMKTLAGLALISG
jgi:8-oxo-dGTP pyrophosphatase MutT (NUDIX family)